jgi:hypothetical protein
MIKTMEIIVLENGSKFFEKDKIWGITKNVD